MTLKTSDYTPDNVNGAGYRVIGMVIYDTIVATMRVALAGELKSIKMLVNPTNVDVGEDLELLSTLKEPQVKLAMELIEAAWALMTHYAVMNTLDDEDVLMDKQAEILSSAVYMRFIFLRVHHKRRDRYVNFIKMMVTAQRVFFEWSKFVLTGESRAKDMSYRCNYSKGRLKALIEDNTDHNVQVMVDMIALFKDCEMKSRALLEEQ